MAGISNYKSLPVAFFLLILKYWFFHLRPKTFPFPVLCDVVQNGVNFAKSLGPSGHFGIYILANKIQKGTVFGSF